MPQVPNNFNSRAARALKSLAANTWFKISMSIWFKPQLNPKDLLKGNVHISRCSYPDFLSSSSASIKLLPNPFLLILFSYGSGFEIQEVFKLSKSSSMVASATLAGSTKWPGRICNAIDPTMNMIPQGVSRIMLHMPDQYVVPIYKI